MKAFLVAVSSLCLCGILLCFWAYATGQLPGAPIATSQKQVVISQTAMETDPLCSPCVENITKMIEIIEKEWEGNSLAFLDHSAPVETEAYGWAGLSKKQREQAKQFFDKHGTEEGLRRFRESDPEAARRFEQRHRPVPSRNVPDGGQLESESKD